MTYDPVYYAAVPENENIDFITQIQAFDLDLNLNQSLRYSITRYNENNFFKIDPVTGKANFDWNLKVLQHLSSKPILFELWQSESVFSFK